jgi:hypothetical protein
VVSGLLLHTFISTSNQSQLSPIHKQSQLKLKRKITLHWPVQIFHYHDSTHVVATLYATPGSQRRSPWHYPIHQNCVSAQLSQNFGNSAVSRAYDKLPYSPAFIITLPDAYLLTSLRASQVCSLRFSDKRPTAWNERHDPRGPAKEKGFSID